jgi:Brp/Blh family beta-carotene 15,15'-monooxygenase
MKLPVFSLIFTVFLLWLTIQINLSQEAYLAYFFILTVGIIHGANDISLITLLTNDSKQTKYKYLSLYLLIIVVTSLTFFNWPLLALLVFVVFSCYHFGEQHFCKRIKTQNYKVTLMFLGYGQLIFSLLFYFNLENTLAIIAELTSYNISEIYFSSFLFTALFFTPILVYVNRTNFNESINYFEEVFLILLFALLFKLASLLWAFAIYFIIWHSLPSLKDQTRALYGNLSKTSILKYVKASSINWGVSVTGLAVIYYLSNFFNIRFITLFFAFLAAITMPHVIVMYFLNKK